MSIDQMKVLKEALSFIEKGAFHEAERLAEKLSSEMSTKAVAYEIRFHLALAKRQWDLARRHVEKSASIDPTRSFLWLQLAKRALRRNELEQAARAANALVASRPPNADWPYAVVLREIALDRMGSQQQNSQDLELAADAFLQQWTGEAAARELVLHRFSLCAGLLDSSERAKQALMLAHPNNGVVREARVAKAVSTQKWCQANGVPYRIIEKPYPIAALDNLGRPGGYEYSVDEVALMSISGAEVTAGWDYIMAPDGYFLHDSSSEVRFGPNSIPFIYLADIKKAIYVSNGDPQFIDDEVLFVSAPGNNHFGHWLSDYLPRLMALRLLDKPNMKIFVPSTINAKLRETLVAADIDPSNVIIGEHAGRYRVRKLHFMKFYNNTRPHPMLMEFVRSKYRPTQQGNIGKKIRLFLNRDDVGTRLIRNWDEFSTLLADYGFSSVNLANLSFREQRQLFSQADIIMGVLGSSLHAMFLIPDNAYVVVLQSYPHLNYWHDIVARSIGVSHISLVCEAVESEAKKRHKKDADVIVNCELLRQNLDRICAEISEPN